MLLRLGHRLFVQPAARIAADITSALVERPAPADDGAGAPSRSRREEARDWWLTTLLASAVSLAIGCAYLFTVWPAALLWFAISFLLPVRGVSEGLTNVPYFLLAAVMLSAVPGIGWWLAGAVVLAAVFEAVCAWGRWRKRGRGGVPA